MNESRVKGEVLFESQHHFSIFICTAGGSANTARSHIAAAGSQVSSAAWPHPDLPPSTGGFLTRYTRLHTRNLLGIYLKMFMTPLHILL